MPEKFPTFSLNEARHDPAKTYGLNVLASAVGRMAIPEISNETAAQSREIFDYAVERLDTPEIPEVPHTSPELLVQAIQFDERLLNQLRTGPAAEILRSPQVEKGRELLQVHQDVCRKYLEGEARREMLTNKEAIAASYHLPNMWVEATVSLEEELERWGKETRHPDVPVALKKEITLEETRALINYVRHHVLGLQDTLLAKTYLVGQASMYHLFWTPTAEGLDYTTPGSYDRATQLSFDVPHNVAHLTHLQALDPAQGAFRYHDGMAERAFFESVAVLSERIITELIQEEPKISEELARILRTADHGMSAEELQDWIVQDRSYEFKLRAARLYADYLILNGSSFEDTVQEISAKLGLPLAQVESESKKYLPWTGLGAVYTHGYRELIKAGASTIMEAIKPGEKIVTTWNEFKSQRAE